MLSDYMYIELKTGFNDDGPAWIGKVKLSKSKTTLYFNGHAFQRFNSGFANFFDVETKERYWISGLKKDGCDRHWAGKGKILIDRRVVNDYLEFINSTALNPNQYEIVDIEDDFPVERISKLLNKVEAE